MVAFNESPTPSLPPRIIKLTETLLAGKSYLLPSFSGKGMIADLTYLVYAVGVTVEGRKTITSADQYLNGYRNYIGMDSFVPHIETTFEVLENSDVVAVIRGKFLQNEIPEVAFEGLPITKEAIISFSKSEIKINLSKVPASDLHLYQEFLVGLCQGGWCDSYIHRHTPLEPGTFNLAP